MDYLIVALLVYLTHFVDWFYATRINKESLLTNYEKDSDLLNMVCRTGIEPVILPFRCFDQRTFNQPKPFKRLPRVCTLSIGYNYPTPLAIKVPKEITEPRKVHDIGEIWRARNLLKVQHHLGSETNS